MRSRMKVMIRRRNRINVVMKRRNGINNPISDGRSSIQLVFVLAPTLVAMPVGDARPTGI